MVVRYIGLADVMEVGRISFNTVCTMCVRMCMDKSQYRSAYYTRCLKRHTIFKLLLLWSKGHENISFKVDKKNYTGVI